jgi:S1-C subfamily serine protease
MILLLWLRMQGTAVRDSIPVALPNGWRCAIALLVFLAGFFCAPASSDALTSSQLYREAKAATVLIVGIDDDGHSLSFGSGVFISADGLILTNAHVIKDATRLFVYTQNQDVDIAPDVVAVEPDWDLAALRISTGRHTAYLPIAKESAAEGDNGIAIGYPRLPDVLRMGLTIHPTVFPVTVTGEAMGRSRTKGQPIPFAQITGFMNAGSSGGPLVLSETGEIAGLVVHSVPYMERTKNSQGDVIGTVMLRAGLSYCIPVQLIRTWLSQSHLGFAEAPAHGAIPAPQAQSAQAGTFAATAHLLHAIASVINGDAELLELSQHHYEAALRLDPERSDILRNFAQVLVAKEEFEQARKTYEKALALAPRDPALLTDAADLWRRMHRAERAVPLYTAAVREDRCYARASLGLGMALKELGRAEEAAASFQRLASCPPTSSLATYRLGLELEEQGLQATALTVWNNFLGRAERVPSNELPILTKIRQRAAQLHATVNRTPAPTAASTISTSQATR